MSPVTHSQSMPVTRQWDSAALAQTLFPDKTQLDAILSHMRIKQIELVIKTGRTVDTDGFSMRELAEQGRIEELFGVPSPYDMALVYYYTLNGFEINKVMNNQPSLLDAQASLLRTSYIPALTNILTHMPEVLQECMLERTTDSPSPEMTPTDIPLYRGAEPYDRDFETLNVGDIVSYPHFFSMSIKPATAQEFSEVYTTKEGQTYHGKGYVYVLSGTNAADISMFSAYSEGEMILAPHAAFVVTAIDATSSPPRVYMTAQPAITGGTH